MNVSNAKQPGVRCICLTGFMGSGKSTVGACLAAKLSWEFVDLDAEIVAAEGRSIAEIFRSDGEPRFRELEHETLSRVLASRTTPSVIALGGGTFIAEPNRKLLKECGARTVYLGGEFAVLLERCGAEQGTRPLAQDVERFRELLREREPVYRSADLILEIADRTPEAIAEEIALELEKRNAPSTVSE